MTQSAKIIFPLFLFFAFPSFVSAQIIINEISPAEEWIELYNISSNDVPLDGCVLYLDDKHSIQHFTFGTSEIVAGNQFRVVEKGITPGWNSNYLNDGGDDIMLDCLNTDDAVSYGNGVAPKTYGRVPDGNGDFVVLSSATKGVANSEPQPVPSSSPTPQSTPTPSSKATSSPTPTPRRTPSPSPPITASPVGKILATGISLILGETESSLSATNEAVLAVFESPTATSSKGTTRLQKILISLASLAVLAMVASAFWLRKRKKI